MGIPCNSWKTVEVKAFIGFGGNTANQIEGSIVCEFIIANGKIGSVTVPDPATGVFVGSKTDVTISGGAGTAKCVSNYTRGGLADSIWLVVCTPK